MNVTSIIPIPVKEAAVRDYDFAVPLEKFTDLTFPPDAQPQKILNEVKFLYQKTGSPALFLGQLGLPAAQISTIKIVLRAAHQAQSDEQPAPLKNVRVYWARSEDTAAQNTWPFSEQRAINLGLAPDQPDTWVADLSRQDTWNGTVERVFISFGFEATMLNNDHDQLQVYLRQIQFISNRYDGSGL